MTDEVDVLVLGGSGVDIVVGVPALPLPSVDSIPVPSVRTRAGQTGDFVCLALHGLGLRTHHLDLIGDDPEGDLVREFYRHHDIALTAGTARAGTRRSVNLVDPGGRRLSLFDTSRTDPADHLPADTLRELVGRSRHVHVSITQPCGDVVPALTADQVTVSTDLHDWDGANPYHEQFARGADVVFVSAVALADPEVTMRRIAAMGRAVVVVATAGPDGAYVLHQDVVHHVPAAPPPGPVVDSNGAGDAFAAGFLFGWLAGEPVARCAAYGSIAGAHACTVPATSTQTIDRETMLARAAGLGR